MSRVHPGYPLVEYGTLQTPRGDRDDTVCIKDQSTVEKGDLNLLGKIHLVAKIEQGVTHRARERESSL